MSGNRDLAMDKIVELAREHGFGFDEIAIAMREASGEAPEQRSTGVLAKVLGYLGGILVLAGIALFIGMQWEYFNSATRVLVTLGSGFALYLFAVVTTGDQRFDRVTTPLLLVSALLQPTGIMVALNEYGQATDPRYGLLFMCVVMFIQQFLTFLARDRGVLLFASLFFGAAGFGLIGDIFEIDFEFIGLALGFGLTSIAYSVDQTRHRAITPFWYFAGSIFFLSAAFELLEGTSAEIVFFGLAAAIMYLATVVRSRTLLFVSVIALTSFTGYFFRDSLANAFGLIVMGLLLIGLSAFAMSLNRKYIVAGAQNDQ